MGLRARFPSFSEPGFYRLTHKLTLASLSHLVVKIRLHAGWVASLRSDLTSGSDDHFSSSDTLEP